MTFVLRSLDFDDSLKLRLGFVRSIVSHFRGCLCSMFEFYLCCVLFIAAFWLYYGLGCALLFGI